MFIIDTIKNEDATGELKLLYKMIEKSLGFVPPHFELFATIDMKGMKEFVEYKDQFQWFLALGIFFLLVDIFLLERKTAWLNRLNLFNENL